MLGLEPVGTSVCKCGFSQKLTRLAYHAKGKNLIQIDNKSKSIADLDFSKDDPPEEDEKAAPN